MMTGNTPLSTSRYSDWIGIFSAFLCLIHCLAGPVLIGLGAHVHVHETAAGTHEHASIWLSHSWDFLFLAIGLVAVWFSARHTSSSLLKVLLWAAYLFLAAMLMLEAYAEVFRYLAYAASLALIGAHILNLRTLIRAHRT
ncbi:MAG: MerC domain-containing protein [Bacteroidota bacterium]